MNEVELKLEVPQASYAEVAAAMGKTKRQRLQARYFDTADAKLAAAGIVVRIRKEGAAWMQTGKGTTGKSLERLEHNVRLARPAAGATPPVDLSRHEETPLGPRIRKALGLGAEAPYPDLQSVFDTDVQRRTLEAASGHGAVEIALDRGRVVAGERHELLSELEFELKTGKPQDAVRLAKVWCTRHGLWLSTISKSAKGWRIAGKPKPAATAKGANFDPKDSAATVLSAVMQACLEQIVANASEVAAGSTDRDHVHQLRVGIRRLRTVLRELGSLRRGIDPDWDVQLTKVFRVLGEHRDQGFLTAELQPQLEAAGAPPIAPKAMQDVPDPAQTVRSPAFQRVLFDLLDFVHRETRNTKDAATAQPMVKERLKKLRKALAEGGKVFVSLEEAQQHRLRKRLKRLRYLAELTAPLFARHKVEKYLDALKPIQDSLGRYNDELMALQGYRTMAVDDARALFGVGWLSARRTANAAACQRELEAFAKLEPFWRK